MKEFIIRSTVVFPRAGLFHFAMLVFRITISVHLIIVHGLKKIGVGVPVAEVVPNPLHLPGMLNQSFAVASDLVFPFFVIFGLLTRIATLPILAVTLTGFFVVHWHDSPSENEMPFLYSLSYLLIFFLGPGKYAVDYWINKVFNKKYGL